MPRPHEARAKVWDSGHIQVHRGGEFRGGGIHGAQLMPPPLALFASFSGARKKGNALRAANIYTIETAVLHENPPIIRYMNERKSRRDLPRGTS